MVVAWVFVVVCCFAGVVMFVRVAFWFYAICDVCCSFGCGIVCIICIVGANFALCCCSVCTLIVLDIVVVERFGGLFVLIVCAFFLFVGIVYVFV